MTTDAADAVIDAIIRYDVPDSRRHMTPCAITEKLGDWFDSGARVRVLLSESPAGWRYGYQVWCGDQYISLYPHDVDAPMPTREAAIDAAAAKVKWLATQPPMHHETAREQQQRNDLLRWVEDQKQMELFA